MKTFMGKISLILICFVYVSESLNILVVLPCYGGHFGAMTTIVQLISRDNHVTVISTSPVCEKKLAPVQKRASFELIKEDIIVGDADMESMWQFLHEIGFLWIGFSKNLSAYLDDYLTENKDNVDIIIGDITHAGVFLSAESFDIPIIMSTPGISLAVEHADEKQEASFMEILIYNKYALSAFKKYIEESRVERNLPKVLSQTDMIPFDYHCRFPSIIYASPSFFPQPHESVDFIFIGGYRNGTEAELLSEELEHWLSLSSLDIIYVSMGTHVKISQDKMRDFTDGVREQNRFRVIWSLSVGMQKAVADLGLASDHSLYFSKYLPQYTLLGHPKVKLFVTHGGLLSAVDVIKRMKPSVCVPQFGDQFYNCRKMSSWGISETITDFGFNAINESAVKILRNYQKYLLNGSKLEKEFSKYEDVQALNDFVEKIAARGKITFIKEFQFQLLSDRTLKIWLIMKVTAATLGLISFVLVVKGMNRLIRSTVKPKTS